MVQFIDVEIETDPDTLADEALEYLAGVVPGFDPAEGNLETWMIRAKARIAADVRDLAADVPAAIFRKFGSDLVDLPPDDAEPATVTATVTMQDTAGYTIPAGTVVTIAASGDTSYAFASVADVTVLPGASATADGELVLEQVLEEDEGGADANGLSANPDHSLSYVSTIVLEDSAGAPITTANGQDAEDDEAYLNRLRSRLRLLTPRPILPADFAELAKDVAGVTRAVAIDLHDPQHNMLTAEQASLEGGTTTGWAALANCTIANSAAHAADGTKSLELSSSGAGDMTATTPTGTSGDVVTPGETYTARAQFKAGTSTRTVSVGMRFYDSGGTAVAAAAFGTGVVDSAANFDTLATYTVAAPATAAYVATIVKVASAGGASEEHYVDKIACRRGTYTGWKAPDSASADPANPADDVPRCVTVVALDENGAGVASGVRAAIEAYLEDMREANFDVFTADPTTNTVDIDYEATIVEGYVAADVEADATAALTAFLDPASWGQPEEGEEREWQNRTVVRYIEVGAVLEGVAGIDHVDDLSLNGEAAGVNVTLYGLAPLPAVGTITADVHA